MKFISFRLCSRLFFALSILFFFIFFCVVRRNIEDFSVDRMMSRYSEIFHIALGEIVDPICNKISDLCISLSKVNDLEPVLQQFNNKNDDIAVYWIEKDIENCAIKRIARVSVGRSLTRNGKLILPINVIITAENQSEMLLFLHLSLEKLYLRLKDIMQRMSLTQINVVQNDGSMLFSLKSEKINKEWINSNNESNWFHSMINGNKCVQRKIPINNTPVQLKYTFCNEFSIFDNAFYKIFFLLVVLLFTLNYIFNYIFSRELSKLYNNISSGQANNCASFRLLECSLIYKKVVLLLERASSYRKDNAKLAAENAKLYEMNNISSFERIRVSTLVDQLNAEKEVIMMEKMVLEEKIEYLSKK